MPTFDLRIKKVKQFNPTKGVFGFTTRAIINGVESFDSVAEEASRNTTLNKYEMAAALGIAAEQFARAIKNGFAVDLGPLGKIYPTVNSKWTETAEEQTKDLLKPNVRYDASAEIKEAVAGARLTWVRDADGEEEVVEEEEEEETLVEGDEDQEGTDPEGGTNPSHPGGGTTTPPGSVPTNPQPGGDDDDI